MRPKIDGNKTRSWAEAGRFGRVLVLTGLGTVWAATGVEKSQAANVLWTAAVDFNEFEGLPGGFENEGPGTYNYQTRNAAAPAVRSYDVLRPVATDAASGRPIYAEGQDGVPDLQIRTIVVDQSGGRWANLEAEKRRDALRADIQVLDSTSCSGDSAIVLYEFTFLNGMEVTAQDFAVRLASTNGHGELYEWSFVTVGGVDQAPFTPQQIASYAADDYSDLRNANFLNPDGTVRPGAAPTAAALPHGRSMSQFLAGLPASDVSGGNVRQGWYAIDDWNTIPRDGNEDFLSNPEGGIGRLPIDATISGQMLGMAGDSRISTFTVWFGYHDIGFDTNGDGFTATSSTQEASVRSINLGASIPESGPALLLSAAAGAALLRRRRRRQM